MSRDGPAGRAVLCEPFGRDIHASSRPLAAGGDPARFSERSANETGRGHIRRDSSSESVDSYDFAGALALVAADPALAQDEQQQSVTAAGLTTLLTDTPEEGFALAVRLSQKAVGMTQTDASVRSVLRPAYAHDPNSLIAVSQVVATHFQTIAAANNYWRE